MGTHLSQILECDCHASLENSDKMKRIAMKQLTETRYELIYQCPNCNRSIRVTVKLTYQDYTKGVIIE
jgi:hypothetical protein